MMVSPAAMDLNIIWGMSVICILFMSEANTVIPHS